MAGKISDLTEETTIPGSALLEVVIGGANYKATRDNVLGTILASLATSLTSSAAELNILDGVTATAVELNHVDGVTSPIQTQLDAKAPTANPTFTGTVTLPTGLTGVLRGDSGVVSVDSDVTDLVSASSLTLAGKVELATTSEINTGTDSTRAIPVDQYVASNRNIRYINWRVLNPTSDQVVGTTVGGDFEFPFAGTIVSIGAFVDTAGVTGNATYDVNIGGTTIMSSTKITVETGEKSSRTATTQPVLTTTAIAAGDILTADIDAIQSETAAKGLTIRLGVRMT